MSEATDYIIASLDAYLRSGMKPPDAWRMVLEDYTLVFHPNEDDNRTHFARAAQVALDQLKDDEEN